MFFLSRSRCTTSLLRSSTWSFPASRRKKSRERERLSQRQQRLPRQSSHQFVSHFRVRHPLDRISTCIGRRSSRSLPDRKFRSAVGPGTPEVRKGEERRVPFSSLLATSDDEGEPRHQVLLANQFLNSRLGRARVARAPAFARRGRGTLSCFSGVPPVFYLTFIMPLPTGSYIGTDVSRL